MEGAVRAALVVVLAERVVLLLELGEAASGCPWQRASVGGFGGTGRSCLGLGVPWGAVVLADAEEREQVLERVAPTAEPGGVDPGVVGEGAGRRSVFLDQAEEPGEHNVARDGPVRGAADQVAGVVIEPVEDLRLAAVSQPPVGDVGLPGLVRLGGLEAGVGAPRALARLRSDQARCG